MTERPRLLDKTDNGLPEAKRNLKTKKYGGSPFWFFIIFLPIRVNHPPEPRSVMDTLDVLRSAREDYRKGGGASLPFIKRT
jgi:hypothetical protein